ncbi:hypothetical protein CGMCC3_g12950 [Colletotrichum fructicola]|nr:uncharacterized protein CGMCC3_g12950 [Colletotrichum fructicola]KAE9571007.1 hypothetical protein CGMCC3_g12950 [Colletotrichum fructicola]KAF4432782.1 hypothetical protein CFRS1_v007731 [Colletotrichum fructicola]
MQGSGGPQGRSPDVPQGSFVKPQVTQTSSMMNPQDSLLNTSNPQEPSFDRDIYFDDDKSSMTQELLSALVDGLSQVSTNQQTLQKTLDSILPGLAEKHSELSASVKVLQQAIVAYTALAPEVLNTSDGDLGDMTSLFP